MKRRFIVFSILFLLILSFSLSMDNNTAIISASNNAFGIDLYKKIITEEKGNIFISPYSISSALAMTYAGARGNTEKQMAKVLYFNIPQEDLHKAFSSLNSYFNRPNKSYQLAIANSLWGQTNYPFQKEFISLLNKYYSAGFNEVDFINEENREKARLTINKWVEDKTNNKIKNLIHPEDISALTRLILVNAIYFKGKWQNQFDPQETRDMPFNLENQKKISVPMMHQEGRFNYTEDDEVQVLELPYSENEVSMIIFLPKEGISLSDFEKEISVERINKLLSNLTQEKVDVYIPKFKMEKRYILNKPLIDLGMKDAFDMSLADFSGMTGSKDLYISKVIHQSFIEVNEEGTEAAAATAVIMSGKAIAPMIIEFKADRPFLFIIRDIKTNTILFMGRFVEP
uniref:Serpin family protein n=1 Tax=Dictyoglomus thermophilum TaxID=14 RepID=A0A7C3RJ16_DICTH